MEEGRIAELENLIAVTRDVFGLDRLRLYSHLLRALSAAEQPDRALVMWTQLQEESLVPPDEMLRDLAVLLRRHGPAGAVRGAGAAPRRGGDGSGDDDAAAAAATADTAAAAAAAAADGTG